MSIFDVHTNRFRGRGTPEVLVEEVEFDELPIIRSGPGAVIEEDIELIVRKKRFRDIIEQIGVERFRAALEELYVRWGAMQRVARFIGVPGPTVRWWFRRLDVPHVLSPPRVWKTEIIGWRAIPEVK